MNEPDVPVLTALSSDELEAQLRRVDPTDRGARAALSAALVDRLTAELVAEIDATRSTSEVPAQSTSEPARSWLGGLFGGRPDPASPAPDAGVRPAAWHPDPLGRHQLRWWDGTTWTEHVADGGAASIDRHWTGGSSPT